MSFYEINEGLMYLVDSATKIILCLNLVLSPSEIAPAKLQSDCSATNCAP